MKNPKTAVIVVSKLNLDLAVLVLKKIENCQIHGLNIIDAKVDVTFKNLAKHIQLLQKEKTRRTLQCTSPDSPGNKLRPSRSADHCLHSVVLILYSQKICGNYSKMNFQLNGAMCLTSYFAKKSL